MLPSACRSFVLLSKSVHLFLVFVGARPLESKGTLVRLPADLSGAVGKSDDWKVKVTEVKDSLLTLAVTSEPDAMIGKYEVLFETKLKDSTKDFSKQDLDTFFYLVCNPWCKGGYH